MLRTLHVCREYNAIRVCKQYDFIYLFSLQKTKLLEHEVALFYSFAQNEAVRRKHAAQ